jgi:phage-related protein
MDSGQNLGAGCRRAGDEIRVHTGVEHRIFDVAKFDEAVSVLHAFEKRTRRAPIRDVELARRRLADLNRRRARKPEVP